jgi:hypothetical protein
VVIDGVAYETVSEEVDGQSVTPESPISNLQSPTPIPASQTTSPRPDNAGEVYTTLSADVVEGEAPLAVNLTGRLEGGPDNNRDYYCVESAFEFGDGTVQSAIPGCIAWTPETAIQREYSASYVYAEPGTYQATFSLDQTRSEPLTIVVRERGEPPAEDTPVSSEDDRPLPPDTPEGPPDDAGAESENSGSGLCLGPLGLLLLPLLSKVGVSRRR